MPKFAKLLGSHGDLVRPAPPENMDGPDRAVRQGVERLGDDVGTFELAPGLRQDSGDVESHIAVADHHGRLDVQGRAQLGEVRMAVIPADEGRRSDHSGKLRSGELQRPVDGSPGGEDHRVVKLLQLGDRYVAADHDIADEMDIVAQRHLLVALRHRLDRLMVGSDPEADQAIGDRKPVDDVDPDLLAHQLLEGLRAVIAGRAGADHRNMPHPRLPFARAKLALWRVLARA